MAQAFGVLDVSTITAELHTLLKTAITNSPLWTLGGVQQFGINVSGAMPESVRQEGGCQLSIYLLHVSEDRFQRNSPVVGPRGQVNPIQPLGLDLYYLLTAYAGTKSDEEQQAMSIAMQCFHANAIVNLPTLQFTLTMEIQSADEISRLWQALATPLRLSAVYKVSVVFLTPDATPASLDAPPKKVGLTVAPVSLPVTVPTQLFGTSIQVTFQVPADGNANEVTDTVAPEVIRAGDRVLLAGAGLDDPGHASVYLRTLAGAEIDVTPWKQSGSTSSDIVLVVGAGPPSPPPGIYLLLVGSSGPPAVRSNAVPIAVAARIDGVATPPASLPIVGGLYTLQGVGFTASLTQVYFGDQPLQRATTPIPAAGQFQVTVTETTLTFLPPNGLAQGRYYIGVRVNQVDSPPSWYVDL